MTVQLTTRANGYIESFHGRFREECLNEHWFLTLDDARETIEFWRIDYNRVRPHSSLGYMTPEQFAKGMPRRRLRAEYAAKLQPECSHLPELDEGAAQARSREEYKQKRVSL